MVLDRIAEYRVSIHDARAVVRDCACVVYASIVFDYSTVDYCPVDIVDDALTSVGQVEKVRFRTDVDGSPVVQGAIDGHAHDFRIDDTIIVESAVDGNAAYCRVYGECCAAINLENVDGS